MSKKTPSLRSLLNKSLKEEDCYAVATYGLKFNNGDVRLQVNDVCHARAKMKRFEDSERMQAHKDLEVTELSNLITPRGGVNKTHLAKWVGYIINESPFKDMFLTKNIQAAFRYGVQMDVEKSQSSVIAALIALREGWEFNNILPNWNMLVRAGVNKDVAFLVSRMFDGNLNTSPWGGHQSIGDITIDNAKTLIKNGLFHHDKPLRVEKAHYAIFKATRSLGYNNPRALKDLIYKGTKTRDGWGGYRKITKKQLLINCKEFEEMLNA